MLPSLRGGMATENNSGAFEDKVWSLPAQGTAEEASLDWDWIKPASYESKMKEAPTTCWTINTGGLEGLWKVLHLIESFPLPNRPGVVFLQETSCTSQQWLGIQFFLKKQGYKGYMTGAREIGSKRNPVWHRGIVTMVNERISSCLLKEVSWDKGQFHALKIGRTMAINSYVVPQEDAILHHVSLLQQHFVETNWCAGWLMAGDWNEEYSGSWISVLSASFQGEQADMSFIDSTRWNGRKNIDYPISNRSIDCCNKRLEKLSDHCIVEFGFQFEVRKVDPHWRFSPCEAFHPPQWLTNKQWHDKFQFAFEEEQRQNWAEACHLVEAHCDWDQYDDQEQMIVDYTWLLTCARLTCVFKLAFWLALLELPHDYCNMVEIQRVTHLTNTKGIRGAEIKMQRRTLPKAGNKQRIKFAKQMRRIGRLQELERRISRDLFDNQTKNLMKKLYGGVDVKFDEVHQELVHLETQHRKELAAEKNDKVSTWQYKMRHNITAKSDWLNKKGCTKTPTIHRDGKEAGTKDVAVDYLRDYWMSFWKEQNTWTDEELEQRVNVIHDVLCGSFKHCKDDKTSNRPDLDLFRQRLSAIKGCPGADNWSREELKMVAGHIGAADMVWQSMQIWEDVQRIPEPIRHCKISCLPKRDKHLLQPNELRPISILSVFWRAWSSTWLRAECNQYWIRQLFPKYASGGLPGSLGPEELASVVAHQLSLFGHGVSLDLSHAFDAVSLDLMERSMVKLLPEKCHSWCRLLVGQWKTMKRWVMHDGALHSSPIQVSYGIPQGDPCGPLVMNILMLTMLRKVEASLDLPVEDYFHALYLDDRTFVGKSPEVVNRAQTIWASVATWFNLRENHEKAQIVDTTKRFDSFEVLGTIIGTPDQSQKMKSRTVKRIDKAKSLHKKIGLLPQGLAAKITDDGIFVRAVIGYGWVSQVPTKTTSNKMETSLWTSLGRTRHSSLHLRRVFAGAHTTLSMIAGLRQLRLLAKRDRTLQNLGIGKQACLLDTHVLNFLQGLQWSLRDDGSFYHDFLKEKFVISELHDKKQWDRTAHLVRESYRLKSFSQFCAEDRHEIRGKLMPMYSSLRRQAMLRWAGNDSTAILVTIGGIQSPLLRFKLRGISSICSNCKKENNPSWEHIWRCTTGLDLPSDVLLARFLWPRDVQDRHLCDRVLQCLRETC